VALAETVDDQRLRIELGRRDQRLFVAELAIDLVGKQQHIALGRQLRFFGDGFQRSKKLGTRRFWRIPVMDGEFVCEERLGTVKGVTGGNLLICGTNQASALAATETAVDAMRKVRGTIL